MLAISLLCISFITFRYVLCIPDLSKTFIIKRCWILSKAFQHLMRWCCVCFCSFTLFIWWIALTAFCMLKHPCISGMTPTFNELFTVFLDSVCEYVIEYLYQCSWKKLVGNSLCVICVSAWLWPYKMNLVMFLLFLFCGLVWRVLILALL